MTCLMPASSSFSLSVDQLSHDLRIATHTCYCRRPCYCVTPRRQSVSLKSKLSVCVALESHMPELWHRALSLPLLSVHLPLTIIFQLPWLVFVSVWPLNVCMSWGYTLPHFIYFSFHSALFLSFPMCSHDFTFSLPGFLVVGQPGVEVLNEPHVSLPPLEGPTLTILWLIDYVIKSQKNTCSNLLCYFFFSLFSGHNLFFF